jgi:CNT family concentrative nucleoside transporter
VVAQLLGKKTVLNEFLGYLDLQAAMQQGRISPRAVTISTYALCGFANPGSIGILIAGLGALIPERRAEVTSLAVKSFIGGTLACFMTACVAGVLVYA